MANYKWPRVSAQDLAIACVSFMLYETSLHSPYTALGHGGLQKKIKKGHHPLIGRKMRLYKLSKAIFNMACNRFFLPLSYSNCFSTYYRKSALLKFQKCSRDGQNVFRSRTLPTPALYPVHYSIKPLFQRVNKTQKFK